MCLPLATYAIKRLVINLNAIVYTFHNTNLQYRCEKIDDIYIYILKIVRKRIIYVGEETFSRSCANDICHVQDHVYR